MPTIMELAAELAAIASGRTEKDYPGTVIECDYCQAAICSLAAVDCPKCNRPIKQRHQATLRMSDALRCVGFAYARSPEAVNLALLDVAKEMSRNHQPAVRYHGRINQLESDASAVAAREVELGMFFRQHFEKEIEAGCHKGKTTNDVLMAYLRRYYLNPRDSWWAKFKRALAGGGQWGI